MNHTTHPDTMAGSRAASSRFDRAKLRALIDEATTDSLDESDEHSGLLSVIGQEVVFPFQAKALGENVQCLGLEWPRNGYGLNVVCRNRRGKTSVVDIAEIEFTDPLPRGHQWIEAYRSWRDMLV